jgi:NAD(P)-dependent dehydrogenase (short-subunit alcohol dehydrogenase family)
MPRLDGKIALITGGASGIGAATARRFIAEGAITVIADINQSSAQSLAQSLGANASAMHLDVSDTSSWQAVLSAIRQAHGRLDILVNCAAISPWGDIEAASVEQWRSVLKVNAEGSFLGCKHAVSLMKETSKAASIVMVSSTMGLRPQPPVVAYDASKSAVWGLTRAVALHCCERGYPIRVNSVHPGVTSTPMFEDVMDKMPDPTAVRDAVAASHPMKRIGQPAEIASAILFLASDEASFITGVALPVDGGYCAA